MEFYTDNYSFKQTTAGLHGQIQLHTDKYSFTQLQLYIDNYSFAWTKTALCGQL